jgi:hypothetical protein
MYLYTHQTEGRHGVEYRANHGQRTNSSIQEKEVCNRLLYWKEDPNFFLSHRRQEKLPTPLRKNENFPRLGRCHTPNTSSFRSDQSWTSQYFFTSFFRRRSIQSDVVSLYLSFNQVSWVESLAHQVFCLSGCRLINFWFPLITPKEKISKVNI